jgi:hypothetical protein
MAQISNVKGYLGDLILAGAQRPRRSGAPNTTGKEAKQRGVTRVLT